MLRTRSVVAGVALLAAGWMLGTAQAPPAPPQPGLDDVVATIEGEKLTPRRIQQLRSSLPPPFNQSAARMNNKTFLRSYAELLKMSRLSETEKLPERDPYKDQLAFLRMNFLAQAYLDHLRTKVTVDPEDTQKYYAEHKADYEEAQVRAIYVAFSPNAGKPATDPKAKKLLTEAQAKAKAEGLAAQLKKGADFVKLAAENSDDTASAEKGGDIGPVKRSASGIPADLKEIIFSLQPGQVSDAVRQPAGFYVFRLDKIQTTPFDDMQASITTTVHGLKLQAEISKTLGTVKITFDNEAFFNETPPTPPAAPSLPRP